jgi:hypothetical protein
MKHIRAMAVLLTLIVLGEVGAQVIVRPYGGLGLSFSSRRIYGGFYMGGYGPGYYSPGFYSPVPYYAYPPDYFYGSRFSSVTIYSSPPPPPQPIVVVPQITVNVNNGGGVSDLRDEDFPDKIIIRPGQNALRVAREKPHEPPAEPPPKPLPGDPAGQFRPLRPEDRDRAKQPMLAEEQPAPAAPMVPPGWDRPEPRPPDPRAPQALQQIELGKLAFSDIRREYARAERRFALAVEADPKVALSHFYLAQAQFAQGKYREAVASIHAGLRLRPDWPTGRFRARELYGPNVEDFTDQLQLLQEMAVRHPKDPVLLFLYAYQLWFDGRQDDAKALFQRALPLVAEPRFIQMFLQAHAGPVVAR